MRRMLCMLTACWLLISIIGGMAQAEPLTAWVIAPVENGLTADFDADGTQESVTLAADLDEYRCGGFTLTVGGASVTRENVEGLNETVYALPVGSVGYSASAQEPYAAIFMVAEEGPSDDPLTYCYLYQDGELTDVGVIPAMPTAMTAGLDGIISTFVRCDVLGTWSRPADYALARGYAFGEDDFRVYYRLTEVPRDIYPLGMILELKVDLPLLAARGDTTYTGMLAADENPQVVVSATDGVRWLYLTSMDGETAGWVKIDREDWRTRVYRAGLPLDCDEVFGNIFYAD